MKRKVGRPIGSIFPRQRMVRLTEDDDSKLEVIAKKHQTTVSQYLRWLIDDVLRGDVTPTSARLQARKLSA